MEKEYRTFTIRRLFIEDMQIIEKYSRCYDTLFFNPLSSDFMQDILLDGAFWAVYDGDVPAAVTYILPADSSSFSQMNIRWNLTDLLEMTISDSIICGYVWSDDRYADTDFYSPLTRLWMMQADRRQKAKLIHCTPANMAVNFERLFYNGFDLAGLRGLDNLVPHYIFIRDADFAVRKIEMYEDVKKCPATDTKTLSMLCEKGYRGFDIDVEKNILFRR